MVQRTEHTCGAYGDRSWIEPACFATFEKQHDLARLDGGLAKRAITQPGINDHRRAENIGEFPCWAMVNIASDLRQVRA